MISLAARAIMLDRPADTRWFIGRLNAISPGNLRLLRIYHGTDVTTNVLNADGRVHTESATLQGRLTRQGNGWMASYNGSNQNATTPDTADLTFIEPLPFSVAAVVNPTNSGTVHPIITKGANGGGANGQEWFVRTTNTNKLQVALIDQSAGVGVTRTADTFDTTGVPIYMGMSYSGTGGATAANGITLYGTGGALVASTASNDASYVAMENLAAVPTIGGVDSTGAAQQWFTGSIGFVAVYAGELIADQHKLIARAARAYFGYAV